jgi:hypothetical protein
MGGVTGIGPNGDGVEAGSEGGDDSAGVGITVDVPGGVDMGICAKTVAAELLVGRRKTTRIVAKAKRIWQRMVETDETDETDVII